MVVNSESGSSIEVHRATVSKAVMEENLKCPLTLEVPSDPVVAEDGRIYERSAIELHIACSLDYGRTLRSPMTNEPMGSNLLPLPQIKSLIEEQDLQPTNPLQEKAMGGDVEAMFQVYCNYKHGTNGFKKDCKEAYHWFTKAQHAKDLKEKEVELLCLRNKLEQEQNISIQKALIQREDAKLIMQLSKKLENMLLLNEDLRDEIDRLNSRLV